MIKFNCQCGKVYEVDNKYAGKSVRCKNCNIKLVVPGNAIDSSYGLQPVDDGGKSVSVMNSSEQYKMPDAIYFEGSFKKAFDLLAETITELKGKILEADPAKQYMEAKFSYGLNAFGIRVCIKLASSGDGFNISFKGILKDAFDTMGHAKMRADAVKSHFMVKAGMVSDPFYSPLNTRSCNHDQCHISIMIIGYVTAVLIPIAGLILGLICCCHGRGKNGSAIVSISYVMTMLYLGLEDSYY